MPTTLKNGMYVTPPMGYFVGLTFDKKYKVFNVDDYDETISFEIKNDGNLKIFCLLKNCAHINNLNWKIVEL